MPPTRIFYFRFHVFDCDLGDNCESMDIDNDYIIHDVGDVVYRVKLLRKRFPIYILRLNKKKNPYK